MIERRVLLALGGTIVGIVGGTVAAANGAPIPGVAAALGAFAAGLGNLFAPASAGATGPEPSPSGTATESGSETIAPSTATFLVNPLDQPTLFDLPTPQTVPAGSSAAAGQPPVQPPPVEPPVAATPPPAVPDDRVPLLIDPGTGLFSEDYFEIAMEARLAAARRHLRPVGVVLLEVVEGLRTGTVRASDPIRVAEAITVTLREADTACRRQDGRFALLLEDTPENGAIWTVERIRRRLVDEDPSLTVWAGVACYPAHAFDSASIMTAAVMALDAAREWRQDRIEVAVGE